MDRMQFLKAFGVTLSGAALLKPSAMASLPLTIPAAAPSQAVFRPGAPGEILVSHSRSEGWGHHTGFGPDYEVLAVRQEREGVFADLRFQNAHEICLRLDENGRDWKAL